MISYWEKESLLSSDIAIVGGGIVGLSVAASIKEKFPQKSITIFDRSFLPYGASTRNAGFACFGSLTEIESDIKVLGEDGARELLFQRWMGLQITRKRLGDEAIGFQELGGFELIEGDLNAESLLQKVNALVHDFIPNYVTKADHLKEGLGLKVSGQLYAMSGEGQVNTGLLMKSMESYVTSLGVTIRTGVDVAQINQNGRKHVLTLSDRVRGSVDFQADKVVICNNAFATQLFPEMEIKPGRGQVFITKPINDLKFQGNLHLDEGYYYLRNVVNRLLFGGARNLDFAKEETIDFELNPFLQSALEQKLISLFGQQFKFEVDQRWTGVMAFGANKMPIVKAESESLFLAVKMGGMGIALAGYIGEEMAEMMDC